jgi:hypothetical protein
MGEGNKTEASWAAIQEDHIDKRRFPRTRKYGPQRLTLTFEDDEHVERAVPAVLWDFSEGGLGMDSPRAFAIGEVLRISGELHGQDYSMAMTARGRVAYSRRIDAEFHRIGVSFMEVSYRRLDEPQP